MVHLKTLIDLSLIVVSLASADQMEAVQLLLACLSSIPSKAHLELTLVPQSILVVSGQCLLWTAKLCRPRSHIDEVVHVSWLLLQVIELLWHQFVHWSVYPLLLELNLGQCQQAELILVK